MADRLEDDTMMLDDWEEEGKGRERDDGKHILEIFWFSIFFSFPFLALSACRIDASDVRRKNVCNG
jgi:hypothetical protein